MIKMKIKKKEINPLGIIVDINCLMFGACKVKKLNLNEDDKNG
jgi:hypothetical protein